MLIIRGNFAGADLTVECKDLDHVILLISILHLDDPLKFDPVHETFLLLHNLSNENKIKKLDSAFYKGRLV